MKKKYYRLKLFIPFVTLADIAFLILIFFIITSYSDSGNNLINLPEIKYEIAKYNDNTNIIKFYISKENIIYYKSKKYNIINLKDLKERIKQYRSAIIIADKESKFFIIYKLINLLSEKGYKNIFFMVKRRN